MSESVLSHPCRAGVIPIPSRLHADSAPLGGATRGSAQRPNLVQLYYSCMHHTAVVLVAYSIDGPDFGDPGQIVSLYSKI